MAAIVKDFLLPGGDPAYLRIALVAIVLYQIVKWVLNRGKYAAFPPKATGIYVPWFGHMFAFGSDPVAFFVKQAREVGEIVSFTLFGRDCVLMISNDAQKAFYDAPEEVLNAAKTYKFTIPCFGPGVVYDADDHKFQQHRKFASAALTVNMFKLYVPKIQEEVSKFIEDRFPGDEGIIDFSAAINELTVLTSTACLQGPEIRAQVHTGYSALIAALDHALSAIGFFYPSLPLPTYIKRDAARRQLGAMFNQILKHRRQSGFRGDDVLQVLMDSKYDDGASMTDGEIVGNLIALMMAGQHTSNITSSWMMINLLTSKGVFNKVFEEQVKVMGGEEHIHENLDFDKVKDMNYLHCVVKETLRLNPPIIVIWRTVENDFKFKEFVVPKGTLVAVSPAAYPRTANSVYTGVKDAFDPDRFTQDRAEDRKEPYSYFAFSSGRHACIGEKFAYLQVKSIFSILARTFELELIGSKSDYPVDNTSLLAAPVGPIKIKYTRRK